MSLQQGREVTRAAPEGDGCRGRGQSRGQGQGDRGWRRDEGQQGAQGGLADHRAVTSCSATEIPSGQSLTTASLLWVRFQCFCHILEDIWERHSEWMEYHLTNRFGKFSNISNTNLDYVCPDLVRDSSNILLFLRLWTRSPPRRTRPSCSPSRWTWCRYFRRRRRWVKKTKVNIHIKLFVAFHISSIVIKFWYYLSREICLEIQILVDFI